MMMTTPRAAMAVLLLLGVAGTAVAAGKKSTSTPAEPAAETAALDVDAKTLRKLSMGIGEETDAFTVTGQQEVHSGAYNTIEYTLVTNDGRKYKCEVAKASKFLKIASWGMDSSSGAQCTEFASKGGKANTSKPAKSKKASGESDASAPAAKPTAVKTDDKILRKISMGIGEEVGDFSVTAQQEVQAGAYYTMEYTVLTRDGRKYKCEIAKPSKFLKIASWGMDSGPSSAMCTDFTKGSKDKGKVNQASCNAMLRAAGKCE